ncbi:Mitochondrial intermediate peptidase, mitochondrial [Vitis vinifera]|uniref:Mitochondrial intermediate peptidase, mitochondrial n=1 Tax=Vitis vinifera TaxID=29760 RepID=A0A438DIN4_VITVI|nr:Mitochondrial intermediate peptidase, mitochondrial [Vitis vinifera]
MTEGSLGEGAVIGTGLGKELGQMSLVSLFLWHGKGLEGDFLEAYLVGRALKDVISELYDTDRNKELGSWQKLKFECYLATDEGWKILDAVFYGDIDGRHKEAISLEGGTRVPYKASFFEGLQLWSVKDNVLLLHCESSELVTYISGMPSSAEIVRAMDEISDAVCSVVDSAELCRHTHPDREFVEEANKASMRINEYLHVR